MIIHYSYTFIYNLIQAKNKNNQLPILEGKVVTAETT